MASTSSVEPSTKRKRVEQDKEAQSRTSTSPEFERQADFWLNDGNIIVQVEDTQFRLHRSILCLNSGFFNNMFDLPQPQDAPVVEGCPLVHCTGDSVQDWKNILMCIYYPHKLPEPFSVSLLSSMLRLGKKYQFNMIRDKAVNHMKMHLPSTCTFDSWKKLLDPLDEDNECQPPGYSWICNHEFDLINIASEVGLQSVLPVLYYLCAVNMKVDYIFDGLPRGDGTISHLSHAAQRIIIVAQTKIRDLIPRQTMKWLFQDGYLTYEGCLAPSKCPKERIRLMKYEVLYLALDLRSALNRYGYIGCVDDALEFCDVCNKKAHKLQDEGRFKTWRELPLLFGLPDWDDIKDFVE